MIGYSALVDPDSENTNRVFTSAAQLTCMNDTIYVGLLMGISAAQLYNAQLQLLFELVASSMEKSAAQRMCERHFRVSILERIYVNQLTL